MQHRCSKYSCPLYNDCSWQKIEELRKKELIMQREHFTNSDKKKEIKKKQNHNMKLQSPSPARSVNVDEAVAFLRRRAARETGSCKLQLHGNMKTTTSRQGVHLRGRRLLDGRRGRVNVSGQIRKTIFGSWLRTWNTLVDVGEDRRTFPTSY